MPVSSLRKQSRRKQRGFSLLEALLALVIFTLISFAISLALSAVFQAQAAAQRREDEANSVRAVFGFLTRDLSAAFVSSGNPVSVFIANGATTGATGQRSSNSLLTLTTLAHRIEMDDAAMVMGSTANANNANNTALALPQADFMLVRYDYDPSSGMLFRTTSAVPNLEIIGQVTPTPQSLLAERVVSLTLRFWDAEQRAWRVDWDYQQQNQASQDTSQDAAGTGGLSGMQANTGSGDTALPTAVEITMTLARKDGTTALFTTTVPIVAPRPFSPGTEQSTTGTNTAAGGAGNLSGTGP